MARLLNSEVVRRWAESWLNSSGPAQKVSYTGSSIRLDRETGVLVYHRRPRNGYPEMGPLGLARYLPRYKTFLLNGDGFQDTYATWAQNNVRNQIQTLVQRTNDLPNNERDFQIILVPYLALGGAEIDPASIRPIAIQEDRWETIYHQIPRLPTAKEWELVSTSPPGARPGTEQARIYEATHAGNRFRTTIHRQLRYRNIRTGETRSYQPAIGEWQQTIIWQEPADRSPRFISIFATPERGATQWVAVEDPTGRGNAVRLRASTATDDRGNPIQGYGWTERIHHLGASLFSAVGEDGKRHKYISAFDEQERTQMYFLAQLPDGSGATTYREAIDALAPPLVHAAREQGRNIQRQGDIFAVETTLSDADVYAGARTRVRRDVALYDDSVNAIARIIRGEAEYPEVRAGEVSEIAPCPCRCGHMREIGWSERARRALMIYGTGHTATEVVVWHNGATFVRGVMHHDPHLEEPGRRREHVDITLGNRTTWFLALRNTVPRRRRRPAQDPVTIGVAEQEAIAA